MSEPDQIRRPNYEQMIPLIPEFSAEEMEHYQNDQLLINLDLSKKFNWLNHHAVKHVLPEQKIVVQKAKSKLPEHFKSFDEYIDWCKQYSQVGSLNDQDLFFRVFRHKALDDLFSKIEIYHLAVDIEKSSAVALEPILNDKIKSLLHKLVPEFCNYNYNRFKLRSEPDQAISYNRDLNPQIVAGNCGFSTDHFMRWLIDEQKLSPAQVSNLRIYGRDSNLYQFGVDHSIICIDTKQNSILIDTTIASTGEAPNGKSQDLEITLLPMNQVNNYCRLRYACSVYSPVNKLHSDRYADTV
ncbi:MAG: hypothetical protein OHK0017_00480 [Patescibacteria group bacterium]